MSRRRRMTDVRAKYRRVLLQLEVLRIWEEGVWKLQKFRF